MSIGKQIREHYYVYTLIDPRDGKPFYVGKGMQTRAYAHVTEANKDPSVWTNPHKCRKILSILRSGHKVQYKFEFCESEAAAYSLETDTISQYGRSRDGGMLTNISLGGECGHPVKRSICVFDKQSNYVCTYESAASCARDIGLSSPNKLWTMMAKGKSSKYLKSLKGFIFAYEGDPPPVFLHAQARSVVIKYDNGDSFSFSSASLAAVHVGVAASTMRNWCNGNSPPIRGAGFECSYEEQQ